MTHSADRSIASLKIEVERKAFRFDLKENDKGRYLRITEETPGHRDKIIIPGPGLADFGRALTEMTLADQAA